MPAKTRQNAVAVEALQQERYDKRLKHERSCITAGTYLPPKPRQVSSSATANAAMRTPACPLQLVFAHWTALHAALLLARQGLRLPLAHSHLPVHLLLLVRRHLLTLLPWQWRLQAFRRPQTCSSPLHHRAAMLPQVLQPLDLLPR